MKYLNKRFSGLEEMLSAIRLRTLLIPIYDALI
jgi:hypothetical protein